VDQIRPKTNNFAAQLHGGAEESPQRRENLIRPQGQAGLDKFGRNAIDVQGSAGRKQAAVRRAEDYRIKSRAIQVAKSQEEHVFRAADLAGMTVKEHPYRFAGFAC
jgi:hypothetical protein